MTTQHLTLAGLAAVILVSCGKPSTARPPSADSNPADGGEEMPSDAGASVGSLVEVLGADCGGPPSLPSVGLTAGTDLRKVTLDAGAARCNDGSLPVLFVRRATSSADADRWLLFLKGGGMCAGADDCATRWCTGSGDDNKGNMSASWLPAGIRGSGLFSTSAQNPFGGWNQVFFYYCSSDGWLGQNPAAVQQRGDGGAPYQLPFMGRHIFEAGLDALRRGVRSDDGVEVLPGFGGARELLLAGASAGSVGAQQHSDRLRAWLDGGVRFGAVFDAVIPPPLERHPDPAVVTRNEALTRAQQRWQQSSAGWLPLLEESCQTAHPGDAGWKCFDLGHVLANHVTSPFIARQDLSDVPASWPLSPAQYPPLSRAGLLSLWQARTNGEEGAVLTQAPAVFGPNCADHVVLLDSARLATQTVRDDAGTAWSFGRAVAVWWADGGFSGAVDSLSSPTSVCP